jgi:hypothetical protein
MNFIPIQTPLTLLTPGMNVTSPPDANSPGTGTSPPLPSSAEISPSMTPVTPLTAVTPAVTELKLDPDDEIVGGIGEEVDDGKQGKKETERSAFHISFSFFFFFL